MKIVTGEGAKKERNFGTPKIGPTLQGETFQGTNMTHTRLPNWTGQNWFWLGQNQDGQKWIGESRFLPTPEPLTPNP